MWTSVALFGYAALTALLTPALLTRARWQVHYPRWALGLWIAAFATGIAAVLAATVNAVALAAGATGHRVSGMVAIGLSTFGLIVVSSVVALTLTSAEGVVDAQTVNVRALLSVPHRAEQRSGYILYTCRSDEMVACSIPGRDRAVVISEGLARTLTDEQLDAVVAHEWVHLSQRHYLAMRLADINAASLPVLPAARGLKRATAFLVELIADDAAARRIGVAPVVSALERLAEVHGDPAMALRAERLVNR